MLGWLWQLFRHDVSQAMRSGQPYADGRYQHRDLDGWPSPDVAAYLAWQPHPNTRRPAPVGFAVVDGLTGERRTVAAFWVAPVVRRSGVGAQLALDVLGRHPAPWAIAFQHDNTGAGRFWRTVADTAFGPGRWTETELPVPHRPDVPPDHWIETSEDEVRAAASVASADPGQ